MPLQVALIGSFLWLGNIPFYICITSSLSNPLSIDTLVTSMSWLLKEYFSELWGAWFFKIWSQSIFFHYYLSSTAWCWIKCLACVLSIVVVVVQLPSRLCNPMDCSRPGFPVHHQLPPLAQTHGHQVSDSIQPSHPLLSPSAFNLSQHQGLFQWVNSSHQVAKYWSFNFSISLSNEYSQLISFRIDWFDVLAVQGILKSLLFYNLTQLSMK